MNLNLERFLRESIVAMYRMLSVTRTKKWRFRNYSIQIGEKQIHRPYFALVTAARLQLMVVPDRA
jgi:hypothetical protein